MGKRIAYWIGKGYTHEQIETHLSFERRKNKETREKRKRNNLKNKELIDKIKKDLLGKTQDGRTILSIKPTVDGKGFWFKMHRLHKDGSEGEYRYFYYFNEYTLKDFWENTL